MGTESHTRRPPTVSGGPDPRDHGQPGHVQPYRSDQPHDALGADEPSPIRQALRAARRGRHVTPEIDDEPNEEIRSGRELEPEITDNDEQPGDPGAPDQIEKRQVDGFELTIKDFGAVWSSTVQGWVVDESGRTVWRPIVTTTGEVPNWEVDTTLGVVTGEAALNLDVGSIRELLIERGGRRTVEQRVHQDRVAAHQAMVEAAVARGAHAVVGVSVGYTPLGDVVLVTATGTAVTLRPPSDQ